MNLTSVQANSLPAPWHIVEFAAHDCLVDGIMTLDAHSMHDTKQGQGNTIVYRPEPKATRDNTIRLELPQRTVYDDIKALLQTSSSASHNLYYQPSGQSEALLDSFVFDESCRIITFFQMTRLQIRTM
jgi:hypothetical protein